MQSVQIQPTSQAERIQGGTNEGVLKQEGSANKRPHTKYLFNTLNKQNQSMNRLLQSEDQGLQGDKTPGYAQFYQTYQGSVQPKDISFDNNDYSQTHIEKAISNHDERSHNEE